MLPRVVAQHRVSAFRVAAAFALLAGAGAAAAQSGVWATRGPEGGSVYCLVADPSRPATLYAGTARGVFKSEDAGASWRFSSEGIPSARVQTIAIDPAASGTLYAGTLTPNGVQSLGIFKSTDAGASWVAINNGLIDPIIGFSPVDVAALAIDPRNSATLFAGTIRSEIFKSTDGGATWQSVTFGGYNLSLQVLDFQIDPSTSTIYAASSLGFLGSTDGGNTWAQYGTAVPLFALAIDPTTPKTIYAGNSTGKGILKSTDGGAHWSAANAGFPVLKDSAGSYSPLVISLALDPAHPSTLYAGTRGNGLYATTNGAGGWTAAGSGVRNTSVAALALAPDQSSTVYAGTLGGGVYQSLDGAHTWVQTNAGLDSSLINALALDPAAPNTVYAATSDGVQKSSDGGESWQAVNTGVPAVAVAALAFAPGSPGKLFAGTLGSGLFTTSDGGATWSAVTQGLADSYIASIGIAPTSAATLYAGTAHPYDGTKSERVFKSADGGATWTQTSLDATQYAIDIIAVSPANASQVIAGSQGVLGYFQSLDAGKTWSTVTNSSCGGVNALVFDASGSNMYIGGTTGVCRSNDGGKTWTASTVGAFLSIVALAMDPSSPSTLYAGAALDTVSGTGGVFRSTDSGQTWEALGSGLSPITVNALAIDVTGKTLHAGTLGGGVAELAFVADRQPVDLPAGTGRRTRVVTPR